MKTIKILQADNGFILEHSHEDAGVLKERYDGHHRTKLFLSLKDLMDYLESYFDIPTSGS